VSSVPITVNPDFAKQAANGKLKGSSAYARCIGLVHTAWASGMPRWPLDAGFSPP
jgi:hypothetical protein